MFHLQILYFMLELAIGIFLLDKGDSWIYLTCCGALIDFFLCVLLCFIPYSLIEVCFFEGSVRFCMINYEICNKNLPINFSPYVRFILKFTSCNGLKKSQN